MKKHKIKPTLILENYIDELVKAYKLSEEDRKLLISMIEEPTDKLYNEEQKIKGLNEKGQS
jgi:hypothetical protein